MKVLHAYVLLALALILTAASPAVSQAQQKSESFVAKVAVSDEAVTFETDGRYDGFVMKVAGPDDFFMQQSFTGDEAPNLRLKTERGLLADGSYTIEVTATPHISKETRAALEQTRGDKAKMREILAEAGIGQRDMVYSVNLGIAEGKFLDPYLEEPAGEEMGALDMGSVAPAPGYVAPPDVTAAGPRFAFQTVDDAARPQFVSNEGDPDSPWMETVFKNTAPDGTEMVYQGYVRPIQSESETPLLLAYFRTVTANGVQGEWYRGYFEFSGDGFRLVDAPGATAAGQQPFDYLTEDAPAPAEPRRRDHFIADDIIGTFSLCVGTDCVNGESFGFTTIKLKENNLRIEFRDTSNSASFPFVDWQLTANDSANGGLNKFSIDDLHNGRTPFTIEANAPSHSLYVDDGGRIGVGTSTPVVELHVVDGDTPTLRLEQDGSSGFTPQTWDVAGNETNWFVRDATNGSPLPLRIRPSAPQNSIYIDTDGDVGMGTASPGANLHIPNDEDTPILLLDATHANGQAIFRLAKSNGTGGANWDFKVTNGGFIINQIGDASGGNELQLSPDNGNLTIEGTLTASAKPFRIDHPLDPGNKFLYHTAIESPDMMNVYNGNVVLDGNGGAVVELPGYFEALNQDFRYQLTPIGAPGPNLYVAEEIQGNRFRIAGGTPGTKISWQVTGIRHDAWANEHRIQVEVDKPAEIRGYYIHPTLFGQPPERAIGSQPEHLNTLDANGN